MIDILLYPDFVSSSVEGSLWFHIVVASRLPPSDSFIFTGQQRLPAIDQYDDGEKEEIGTWRMTRVGRPFPFSHACMFRIDRVEP